MRSIVVVGILAIASVARAEKPKIWARPVVRFASTPGGAAIAVQHTDHAQQEYVIDQHGDAIRVELFGAGARLRLWIDAADVVPSVIREVGVAASATARAPAAGGDGLFVEPGVTVDDARKGDRVHVTYDDAGTRFDGWIDASAVGTVFTDPSEPDWPRVPAGTKIVAGGRTIAIARWSAHARTRRGRTELWGRSWLARGTMIAPKAKAADDDVDEGEEGGVVGGVIGGSALVPDGTCLYDDDGHEVGVVDHADLLDDVVRTKDGFLVDVSSIASDARVRLHARVAGGKVEMCPIPRP